MAIVQSIRTKSGALVHIDDRYAAAKGTPEYDAACRQARKVAQTILVQAATKQKSEVKQP